MERAAGYWKRFAVLGIDSVHKYRYDPFFRTEATIIVMQAAFAAFLLIVLGVITTQLYRDAAIAVNRGLHEALASGASPSLIGLSVIDELRALRARTVLLAAGTILAVTAAFTFFIARLALSPTRSALSSQKQFIGNVAHELRTPLAVCKTNIEVALLSSGLASDLRESLASTVEELDRASEIINNLLSLSASIRPERIEFANVDLGGTVSAVMRKLRDLADSKRLVIEARMSERRIVWGNSTALEQIVMNVVKNAISYSSDGARVLVTLEPVKPDFMELTVRDSGKGIPRKDLFRIFEPYYRVDPSRVRSGGGSGLGLTIVSELVKLHNGRITIRSAEGRGTTVTVLLPAGTVEVGSANLGASASEDTSEVAIDFSRN